MSSEGETIIRSIMSAVDKGDVEAAMSQFADGFAGHYASTLEPLDRDAMRMMFTMFTTTFPDGSHRFESFVSEGESVAFCARWTATQQGEFNGLPASGAAVDIIEMGIGRIEDGKLAEMWMMPDHAAMMQQLTAPSPSA
jgi:steroid delta-isomerase-like uncharacterized protein